MKIAFVFSVAVLVVLAACSADNNAGVDYRIPSIDVPSVEHTVLWGEAVQLLHRGNVGSIMQSHNLQVGLVLKNGTQLRTTEPVIDAIMREVKVCGPVCEGIIFGTE